MNPSTHWRLLGVLLALVTLLPGSPVAQPIGNGDAFPATTLPDQHGRTRTIGPAARLVLFAPDRSSGSLVHSVLHRDEGGQPGRAAFDRGELYVVADISGMPELISRFFALPTMRGYSYPLLVASVPEEIAHLPRRSGEVTLIQLQDGRVTGISYADSAAAIESQLHR
jgi:hypothetical protein